MVTITTTDKSVTIQTETFKWNIVKSRVKGQIPFASGTRLVTEMGEIPIIFNDVTGDGEAFESADDLQAWIETNCFSDGGGTGEGVQSKQEEGKGWPIKNYIPMTQGDYDSLTVKNPQTEYPIVDQYPEA